MNNYIGVPAVYTNQAIDEYKGNPFIEALNDIVDNYDKMRLQTTRYPQFSEADRALSPIHRFHLVKNLDDYFKPFNIHYNMEQVISRLIRRGYVNRNIFKAPTRSLFAWEKYPPEQIDNSTISMIGLFGISGIGKSTLINNILGMYPRVIIHSNYKGDTTIRTQIVHLTVQVPRNGSTNAILLSILSSIDRLLNQDLHVKRAARKNSVALEDYVRDILELYNVGVIVLDELQNLHGIHGKLQQQVLNMIVSMSNTFKTPIILVGTPTALTLFSEFRSSRRVTGEFFETWKGFNKDEEWAEFISDLFQFQWTHKPVEATPEITDLFYFHTQGIADIARKLFSLCQYRAISTGLEEISVVLINSVAKDSFELLNPMLEVLRSGDNEKLKKMGDLYCPSDLWDKMISEEEAILHEEYNAPAAASIQAAKNKAQNKKSNPKREKKNTGLNKVHADALNKKKPIYDSFKDNGNIAECGEFIG